MINIDGTGYAEDGRDLFEDEDDYSDDAAEQDDGKKKKAVNAKKRPRDADKPAKGKASIRNLFSNAVPKKVDVKNSVKDDDILADILGEIKEEPSGEKAASQQQKVIAPAKIVNATRKSEASAAKEYMNNFLNNIKIQEQERRKSEVGSDDEMLERILQPKAAIMPNKKVAASTTVAAPKIKQEKPDRKEESTKEHVEQEKANEPEICDNDLDFSCLDDDENQFEVATANAKPASSKPVPQVTKATVEVEVAQPEDMSKLLNNWESICQMDDDFEKSVLTSDIESVTCADPTDVEHLRFWYWEAWEDAQKLPGEVFLFGRTADGKSICVRVQNINRVLYLLPRQYVSMKGKLRSLTFFLYQPYLPLAAGSHHKGAHQAEGDCCRHVQGVRHSNCL